MGSPAKALIAKDKVVKERPIASIISAVYAMGG